MQVLFLLTFVFFLSIFCTLFYKKIANVHGPFSIPNNRTLHEKPVVNGGGISIIFSSFIGYLVGLNIGLISLNQFFIFGFLALLTGLIGVLDERINIKPKYQFFTQN